MARPRPSLWAAGAARFLLAAGAAFALARAVLAGGIAPFALALFAAGVVSGRHVAALLAGCALGALGGRPGDFNLSLPVGCAVILGGELLRGALIPRLGRLRAAMRRFPAIQARSPNEAPVRAAALAGAGALGPGLALAGGELWPSALATGAALLALGCAPLMLCALGLDGRRRHLLSQERAGLGLMAAALAAGLWALWPPLGLGFALLSALAAGPAGAAVGAAAGGAMLLVSGDARCLAAPALGGAAAQLCGEGPRGLREAAACGAALLAGAWAGLDPLALAGLAAALPGALLLPDALRDMLSAWLGAGAGCDPGRLAEVARGQSAARLRAMAAAFGELAEGYLAPEAPPDGQALLNQLRRAQCEGCTGFDDCWAGESNRGARVLCDLVGLAVSWSETAGEAALFESEVPLDIARRCRRSRAIPERLGEALEDFALARRAAQRRSGENRLISAQFLQAQQLLSGMAEAEARPLRFGSAQARRAAAALERAGIALSEALALELPRPELILTLREGAWTPALANRAAAALAEALGRRYAPLDGVGGRSLALVRRNRLSAITGAAAMPREAGAPSGDSHLIAALEDGRLMAVLCDGMGSGEAAARESAAAVRLLGRFLAAGADWPLAVETANAMLLNTAGEEMFSTMDLLLLNLSSGNAEFVKLAACPALISREGAVERVEGGRLPLGILDSVRPAAARVRLQPGDVVLLASDGVMDAADPAALQALLSSPGADMNALAERVLALALEGAPPEHRDDMTALCVRVGRG